MLLFISAFFILLWWSLPTIKEIKFRDNKKRKNDTTKNNKTTSRKD